MPRRPRFEAPGAIHHVVAQGNNRAPIVLDDRDRSSLLRGLAAVARELAWKCHAYCLLDTHLHVVLETPEPNLGSGMAKLLGRHAYSFNRRHCRDGHLFSSPFYSRPIARDGHLLAAAVYVVVNPVAAGVCRRPWDWPWTSYLATAEGRSTFVTTDLLLGMLGGHPESARERYRAIVDQAVARILAERPQKGKRSGFSQTSRAGQAERQGSG